MPSIIAPATVLVTGANGFIGSWVCKTFLENGYHVRGTVRSSYKGEYLSEIFKEYGERFVCDIVEDITMPGAFDKAVEGVQAVIHTASPAILVIDDPQDLIGPAVDGTLGLIHSINTCGKEVKRLVCTSSISAIIDPTRPPGGVYTDDDWNPCSVKEVELKGRDAKWDKYRASKILAEKAAWDEAEKQDRWDLVVINPSNNLGPVIHQVTEPSELNTSIQRFYSVISAKDENLSADILLMPDVSFGDVRDVGLAHMRAVECEGAGGHRFLTSSGAYTWQDALDVVPAQYPKPLGSPGSGKLVKHSVYDATKASRILGIKFKSLEEIINDTVFDLHRRGWLPARPEQKMAPSSEPVQPNKILLK
ncbi:unnamed protein product [Rhizoctonia solani]|uniref:NAD-dependent epimerase/dehydratase domain-containing protein n=1 Tax=Rhizoctonia solani TaxID=456999 RepID=A0A8H3GVH9_9AGAM|nr:unnamed protein product [Rhizoctonia solani]